MRPNTPQQQLRERNLQRGRRHGQLTHGAFEQECRLGSEGDSKETGVSAAVAPKETTE